MLFDIHCTEIISDFSECETEFRQILQKLEILFISFPSRTPHGYGTEVSYLKSHKFMH